VIRFTDDFDKTYQVTVVFGQATDTQDLTGKPVWGRMPTEAELASLRQSDYAALRQAVAGLAKVRLQVPPMYSAVKQKGRPLYEYARQGLVLEREPRPVRIYESSLLSIEDEAGLAVVIRIHCSKGTYIRSLCDQLGRDLGWGAHAAALRRLSCGPFQIESAWPLEQLPDAAAIKRAALEPAAALAGLPEFELDRPAAAALVMGQPVYKKAPECPQGLFSIWTAGQLVGVGRAVHAVAGGCQIKTERVLIDLADLQEPE
jgi:tRNA pseudouridine55 synthase